MQDLPPVEVIRTVVALTAPLLAAGPKALTQSPTARSLEDADWVVLTVVEPDVVIVRLSVFWVVCFFDELVFAVAPRPGRLPGENVLPVTEIVDPLTVVTLPLAMESEASCDRKLFAPEAPEGKLGRVPLPPSPDPLPAPPRNPGKPPAPPGGPPWAAPAVRPPNAVHDPLDDGVVTVMLRAAMVVLDFFDAVPVTETQSPAASELTACVTVLENVVMVSQLTVVCPELGFCTSMVDPLSAATLPEAPIGRFVVELAAPAGLPSAASTTSAVVAPPRSGARRRSFELWLVGVNMWSFLFLLVLWRCLEHDSSVARARPYSLRKASMGASDAARLAGYTPKSTPMAKAMASAPTAAVALVVIGSPMRPGR